MNHGPGHQPRDIDQNEIHDKIPNSPDLGCCEKAGISEEMVYPSTFSSDHYQMVRLPTGCCLHRELEIGGIFIDGMPFDFGGGGKTLRGDGVHITDQQINLHTKLPCVIEPGVGRDDERVVR